MSADNKLLDSPSIVDFGLGFPAALAGGKRQEDPSLRAKA
jgi:hypothetical protein